MTAPRSAELWLTAPGRIQLREVPVTDPGPGEVLVRTTRTLISTGTELTLFNGAAPATSVWGEIGRLPRVMGYSQVGEVVAAGAGVDRGWIGRRVGTRGPHGHWVCWPAADLRELPDALTDEEGSFGTLAGVVMNGLRRVALSWGESVAVCGLGLIGNLAAQLAGAAGATPVFALELAEQRLAYLPARPWIHPLRLAAGDDLHVAARLHAGAQSFDVVIEATADPALIADQARLLRTGGRLLLLSSPVGATSFDFHDLCNRRSLTIVGAHGSSQPPAGNESWAWTSKRHAELFFSWLVEKRVEVASLVTHRFPFERAAEAYELLATRRGSALGVVLEWS